MEDSTEELSDAEGVDAMGVVQRAMALADRVRQVGLSQPDASAWFAIWKPVIAAVIRLAKTLGKLLNNLRKLAEEEETFDPIDAELRAELAEELADITREFPDVADVLFGLPNIDAAFDALKRDGNTRELARALYESSIALLDRFLAGLVDIVLSEQQTPLNPDRIMAALERLELVAERLLDRWLLPEDS